MHILDPLNFKMFLTAYIFLIAPLTLKLADGTNDIALFAAQRDDPSEYTQLGVVSKISKLACIATAAEARVSAALYDGGTCWLLMCNLGEFGCRKCRNMRNSSLPLIWMRQLNGVNFCWKTFQHRVDASVDFNLPWNAYVAGFGQGENANYWMGLEILHQLTKDSPRRVRWEFSDWNGKWFWSENPNFTINSESDMYRANMGSYSADRSSMAQYPIDDNFSPNGKQFSTIDRDNSVTTHGTSCAPEYNAGWWFGRCAFLNPNGVYYMPPTALNTGSVAYRGIFFMPPQLYNSALSYSMRTFECLIEDWP